MSFECEAAGFSAATILELGHSAAALRLAGYDVSELRALGLDTKGHMCIRVRENLLFLRANCLQNVQQGVQGDCKRLAPTKTFCFPAISTLSAKSTYLHCTVVSFQVC